MRTDNKEEKFSNITDIDAVKRALESIGDSTNKKTVKEKGNDNFPKRRFIRDQGVIVKKQNLEKFSRKTYFQDFSVDDKLSKYNRKLSITNEKDENNFKTILKHIEMLVEKMALMQKQVENLEKLNIQLSEQFKSVTSSFNKPNEIETVEIMEDDDIVDELGQKPVKWWIRKLD